MPVVLELTVHQVCSCSGYRYISLDRHASEGPIPEGRNIIYLPPYKANLRLMDFSPFAVRRLATAQSAQTGDIVPVPASELPEDSPPVLHGVFTEPSVMPHGKIWREDVVSGLPYTVTVREEGITGNGVMMDDQRVMVVSVSPAPSSQDVPTDASVTGPRAGDGEHPVHQANHDCPLHVRRPSCSRIFRYMRLLVSRLRLSHPSWLLTGLLQAPKT